METHRLQLAMENNDIIRFAHETDPENCPDGPYADVYKIRGEILANPQLSLRPPPFFGIGMTYLPEGVTMVEDWGNQAFIVRLDGTVKKFSGITAANCLDIFTDNVLPLLRASDAEFDTHNAAYQRLADDSMLFANKEPWL